MLKKILVTGNLPKARQVLATWGISGQNTTTVTGQPAIEIATSSAGKYRKNGTLAKKLANAGAYLVSP